MNNEIKIFNELTKNKEYILKSVDNNLDIIVRDFKIFNTLDATIFFVDGMSDKFQINRCIVAPLQNIKQEPTQKFSMDFILDSLASFSEMKVNETLEQSLTSILNGDCVLFVDGESLSASFGVRAWTTRGIQEPPTSITIKGPREGFSEDLKLNMTLVRRKLRTPNLRYKHLKIGKYTNTNVIVCYIDGITDMGLISKVEKELKKIDIDGIIDSAYISSFLSTRKYSIFKQVGTTEKPDILVSKLLEGRIGIIVDGSPIVLTVPFLVMEDFNDAEDYYSKPFVATFKRVLRYIAVFVAVLMPAIFVCASVYHTQLMPLNFLLTLVKSTRDVPLSPSFEMFLTLIIFEILREASVRMPRFVGTALSIIGALVLGETAVNAGLISTPTIMIMAISGIAIYTVPEEEGVLSILRIIFLALGSTLGVMGIVLGVIFLATYLSSISNFGTPYLMPFAPLIKDDLKDSFFKVSLKDLKKRPKSIPNKNKVRQG